MPTPGELLLALVFALLQIALVMVVSPPRVGVVAQLVDDRDRRKRVIRLAVQSMEAKREAGPFTIEVRTQLPGKFEDASGIPWLVEPDPGKDAANEPIVRAYVGTDHDAGNVTIAQAPGAIGKDTVRTIEVAAIRPMKTWVFELEVSKQTANAHVRVHGERRRLGAILPVFEHLIVGDLKPPTRYEFGFPVRYYSPPRHKGAALTRPEPAKSEPYAQWRVLGTVLASSATLYAALNSWLGPPVQTEAMLWELGGAGVLLLVISLLQYMTYPDWPLVAQGYLEPRKLPVTVPEGKAARSSDA